MRAALPYSPSDIEKLAGLATGSLAALRATPVQRADGEKGVLIQFPPPSDTEPSGATERSSPLEQAATSRVVVEIRMMPPIQRPGV
jgi:hypothetical protein